MPNDLNTIEGLAREVVRLETICRRMSEPLRRIADGHYKVCHDPFVPVCYCARCIAISALVPDAE